MLRTVIERGRFVDHVRIVAWMTRRETIVATGLNMQEFVEWIAVWQPRCTFLFRTKQIASFIKCESDRKADSRTNRFSLTEIRCNALHRASLALEVISGLAGIIYHVSVREICSPQAKIQRARVIHRDANGVDVLRNLFPTCCDHHFLVRFVVPVGVDDQRYFAFAGNKRTKAFRIAWRCQ